MTSDELITHCPHCGPRLTGNEPPCPTCRSTGTVPFTPRPCPGCIADHCTTDTCGKDE